MTIRQSGIVLAVDLGKTSCRVRMTRGGQTLAENVGPGAPGLADQNGAALSFDAISAALNVTGLPADPIVSVGIGAAGVQAAREATTELIRRLRTIVDAPVAVLTDALTAHAGAFGGAAGTVLIAGTGAVVFAVADDGAVRQIDGWGPWLGDEGSGRWIGQRGLIAVMHAHDGRGPATALSDDAAELVTSPALLPLWVSQTGAPARRLGTFARSVLTRAEAGDSVAVQIVDEATRTLAAAATASGDSAVCPTGGLTGSPYFAARLTDALASAGIRRIEPAGDALDGARLIATSSALPYEERIIRG